MWAKNYDKCIECGTTERKHKAKGLCARCYEKYSSAHRVAVSNQKFTCLNCGKEFAPKWKVNSPRKFCCHKCSEEYHTGKPRGKQRTREEIITAMRSEILKRNEYIQMPELMRVAHTCYDTITKLNITRIEVYRGIDVGQPNSVEDQAYYILSDYIDDLEMSKVFDDCRSPKGRKLRFDLYSESLNLLIEVDGVHHRESNSSTAMLYFRECDRMKEVYAVKKGIRFVRVEVRRHERVTKEILLRYLPDDVVQLMTLDNQQPSASDEVRRFNDQSQDVGPSGPKSGACADNHQCSEDMVSSAW